jgi:hypothetical protein
MVGADALVLFNRFYQPDIDIENLEVVPHVLLSTAQDRRVRAGAIYEGDSDLSTSSSQEPLNFFTASPLRLLEGEAGGTTSRSSPTM